MDQFRLHVASLKSLYVSGWCKNDEIHLGYPSLRYMSLELLLKGNCRVPGAVKEIIESNEPHKLFLEQLESNYTITWHGGKEVGRNYSCHVRCCVLPLFGWPCFLTVHRHGQLKPFCQTWRLYKSLSWFILIIPLEGFAPPKTKMSPEK